MSETDNSFQHALAALAGVRVDFVVIGVGGINFYAREPGEMVLTQDLALLLAPRLENFRAALAALHGAGFAFSAGGEPFVDVADPDSLGNRVRNAASLTAQHPAGAGRLEKLLASKERAGRPKDLEFLRLYAARLRSSRS